MYPVGPGHSKHLFDLYSGVACLAAHARGGHELPGEPHGAKGAGSGNVSVDDGAPAILSVQQLSVDDGAPAITRMQ